jgi:hypothetical protein
MKKAERQHLSRIASMGCIVCKNEGLGDTPACIHHIRNGYGRGQRAPYDETLPLCANHHQFADGTDKFQGHIAFHQSPQEFESRYGTERQLLAQVRGML